MENLVDSPESGVEGGCIWPHLHTAGAQNAAIRAQLEELNWGNLHISWLYGTSPPIVDDKLATEVWHKLGVLLLLVGANNLQFFSKQRLELLLQAVHGTEYPALIQVSSNQN